MAAPRSNNSSEQALVRSWYHYSPWLLILAPLSMLYGLISAVRRTLYRLGVLESFRAPVPVVVVGNISVGGTGKTPLVIALVEALKQAGYKPGVISRGYGSHAPQYPYQVTAASPVAHSGDEPLLIALRSQAPLVIGSNRKLAITQLLAAHDCDVIISDDGLQHFALERDYEIVVVDGQRGFGNRFLLPAGPLRESVRRLHSVNHVVFNDTEVALPSPHINSSLMRLVPDVIKSLDGDTTTPIADWPHHKRVHAVAGIGNPQRFFNTLSQLGFDPIPHHFADHHDFTAEDCQFNDDLAVIMTEKDAVKMRALSNARHCWYLPVSAAIEGDVMADVIATVKQIKPATKESP